MLNKQQQVIYFLIKNKIKYEDLKDELRIYFGDDRKMKSIFNQNFPYYLDRFDGNIGIKTKINPNNVFWY